MQNSEKFIRQLFDLADIQINGSRPWDIQIHDPRFYDRVVRYTTLGLGESYVEG
jgi:cyclopropane-fatty-acyl-phospholipid synthase